MSKVPIPADGRVQVVTQQMLASEEFTLRAREGGPDVRVFGRDDEEGEGYPLRADDEWCIAQTDDYGGAAENDGLWMETETSESTDIQIIKGACIRRNVRREQRATIEADTSGLLKAADQPFGVEQETPVAVENTAGAQVDPLDQSDAAPITATDSGTGSENAAELDLGALRSALDIHVDTSGAAQLTVEVSADGETWRPFDSVDYSGAATEVEQYETSYRYVRAYLDSSRNVVEVASKGVA